MTVLALARSAVAGEARRQKGVGGGEPYGRIEFFLGALKAQTHHDVRVPVAAFGKEVATRIERDTVLAPVQVLVRVVVGILIIELAVERPVRVDELAQAQCQERGITGTAIVVLDVDAGGTGEVPAIIEVLGASHLGHTQATQQGGAEKCLIHV